MAKKLTPRKIESIRNMYSEGLMVKEVAKKNGVSEKTVFRYISKGRALSQVSVWSVCENYGFRRTVFARRFAHMIKRRGNIPMLRKDQLKGILLRIEKIPLMERHKLINPENSLFTERPYCKPHKLKLKTEEELGMPEKDYEVSLGYLITDG